ncbi:LysR family transcriptional regulator [Falsirhodobacter xinxiangensis]|uniref:LysR family transcriptional regulator n=1 Tax=Falsirhodobacter xinxiangensis TaxID=2530049 RepID=UPI0010AAE807|nr:LysR family transcriptional regulator [Rhodobacter xinxiangensis]
MPLPSNRHLEAFMALAEARSFRIAAARMGMSQPALSQNIALLEAHVGAALFLRTTRAVTLTAEGVEFRRHLADALPALQTAVDSVRNFGKAPARKLRLGFLASAVVSYLPEALTRFRNDFPEVEVTVRDDAAEGLFNAVHRGDLDLAVSSFLPHGGLDVTFTEIVKDPFYAVMRHDHPLAAQARITWAELVQYDIIGANVGSGTRFAVDAAMREHGRSMKTVMDFNHFLAVAGMVDAGLGVSALPLMNCPRPDHPTLRAVELVDPVVTRNLGIITGNRDGDLSGYVLRFRDGILGVRPR